MDDKSPSETAPSSAETVNSGLSQSNGAVGNKNLSMEAQEFQKQKLLITRQLSMKVISSGMNRADVRLLLCDHSC